jgi:peptide-methionine (S)-S-oxide reductase
MITNPSRRTFIRLAVATLLLASVAPGSFAAPQKPKTEEATLAAGCFWSMEEIFRQIKGVQRVDPGYSGGKVANPKYDQVTTGTTGHAETLNIVFDPSVVSYSDLLRVLLTVRNPTTLNKQGNDEGPHYRSVIFYRSEAQKKAAQDMIRKFTKDRVWSDPIVTRVEPFSNFYRAEKYHYNYYRLHPEEAYCKYVIAPEIEEFRTKFKSLLRK